MAVEEIATLLQLYPRFGRPCRFVPDEQFTSRVRHKFNKFTMYSYDNAVPKKWYKVTYFSFRPIKNVPIASAKHK